jgi:CRISPR system Cascade subunit CasD
MSTLLLRFAGPLQAWGSSSRFSNRMTEREPTKSGVIGLIAAAMGRRRTDSIDDLTKIRFGVRIDQVGKLLRDFHTVKSFDGKQAFISDRYYLSDAVFLVGIEGDDALLNEVDHAIKHPFFPLFLGRRSCPPEGRISLGIREGVSLGDALESECWQAHDVYKKKQAESICLDMVIDGDPEDSNTFLRRDEPISYDQTYRKYGFREVNAGLRTKPIENPISKIYPDPMGVLDVPVTNSNQ